MFDSFGLDISDLSIKYVYLKPNLIGLSLGAVGEVLVPEGVMKSGEIVNQDQVVLLLRQVMADKKITTRFVNVSLPDSKTFIKLLEIPQGETNHSDDAEQLEEMIRKELANHIPLSVDLLTIDWEIVSPQNQKQGPLRVLVAACDTKTILEFTTVIRAAGMVPTAFEVEAQAIVRATMKRADFIAQKNGATVIIDLGQTQTNIIFIQDSAILFTNSLLLSGQEITRKIAEKLSFSIEQAEKAKVICGLNPKKCKGVVKKYLEEHIGSLAQEIQKSIEFYKTHFDKHGRIESVILVGGGANLKDLDIGLESYLGVRPEYGNVFVNISKTIRHRELIPSHQLMSFATAIGLATRDQ